MQKKKSIFAFRSIQQRGTRCWLKHHVCTNEELVALASGHDYVRRGPGENCDFLKEPCEGKKYSMCILLFSVDILDFDYSLTDTLCMKTLGSKG